MNNCFNILPSSFDHLKLDPSQSQGLTDSALHAQLPDLIAHQPQEVAKLRTNKGYTALHVIIFMFDESLLESLFASLDAEGTRCLVNAPDKNEYSPLHMACKLGFELAVDMLLERGADVHARTKDLFGLAVGGFKILPICGGKTPLHFAAQESEGDGVPICKKLLDCGADPQAKDYQGYTPCDLALFKGNKQISELLHPNLHIPSDAEIVQARKHYHRLCLESEAVWKTEDETKRFRIAEAISVLYQRRHPNLFEISDSHIHEPLLHALKSADFPAALRALVLEPTTPQQSNLYSGQVDKSIVGQWLSTQPPLLMCRVFSTTFCEQLLEEVEHFKTQSATQGWQISRPNSMNRYGVILNHIGMRPVFDHITKTVIEPLVNALLAPSSKPFDILSHHSFVVSYRVGEDIDLATHADASDVTVNLCLGKQFEGADLYFHGERASLFMNTLTGNNNNNSNNSNNESCSAVLNDEFVHPHPKDCEFCRLRYRHEPGVCVIHRGALIHGVDQLVSGERSNLVIWCRTYQ